jgi:hypothetical protein
MGIKHPLAYIDAYLNQFNSYFAILPESTNAYNYQISEKHQNYLLSNGILSYNAGNSTIAPIWSTMLALFALCPVLYLITNGAFYFWILVIICGLLYKKKQTNWLWFYVPFFLYFSTLLLSPSSAFLEYRYLFPYLIAMPVLMLPLRTVDANHQSQ